MWASESGLEKQLLIVNRASNFGPGDRGSIGSL